MRTVLLVEDDPDLRLLLGLILREDPSLEVAGKSLCAHEALDLAVSVAPNLVILDNQLGGGRLGLTITPELKARCPNTRILLFTSFAIPRRAFATAAVDAVLRKDEIRSLLPTVRELLALPIAI